LVATEGEHPVNLADLWSVLDNDMRLGFTVVSTLELDLDFSFEAPLVLEATVRIGQSDTPSEETLQAMDVEFKHTADNAPDDTSIKPIRRNSGKK
jgi:hypothetical protein